MNWITSIRKLLGRFWSAVFSDHDFLDGVETTMALACRAQQAGHDKWAAGYVSASDGLYADMMPFTVYIDVAAVSHPATDIGDVLNGDAVLGGEQQYGYSAISLYPTPKPVFLADHVVGYTKTLLEGFDYDVDDQGQYLFHVDPATLNLPQVPLTVDGEVRAYYRLFGWAQLSAPVHDAVVAFHGDALDPYAEAVWDMHQKGATLYNVKKLLAGVTGSVVCDKDGAIDHLWTEQGLQCMLVGDKVYSAPAGVPLGITPAGTTLAHGDNVKRGQILFGELRLYTGNDAIPAAAVPGLHVMTDAGELRAMNDEYMPLPGSTVTSIPLEGDPAKVSRYGNLCLERSANMNCPYVELPPDMINPMLFILQRLRRGRAVTISLVARNLAAVSAALACIRRCSNATGMINVYVQAESDTLAVSESFETASFAATAGEIAVSTVATVAVQDMFAEAQLTL